jgi:hypothetical protein
MNEIISIAKCVSVKGRNRLREHGKLWRVVKDDTLDGLPAMLTESVETGYLRWWKLNEIEFTRVQSDT